MDWSQYVGQAGANQYRERISFLNEKGVKTESIENTVEETIDNLSKGQGSSFVIFGEPQSGKTEMMIALNARLLDEGRSVIVNLLTDSVDLLSQSLSRFRASGLSPSPKQFSELPASADDLAGRKWVIFSKKNARDLEKLIELLRKTSGVVVIDDEADYASPNAKVNRDEKTKINKLIHQLIGSDGQYIGVTATPARLNLNNTFDNQSELWVDFKPHAAYVGQDFFFPSNGKVDYRLRTFPADEGNDRVELQTAILHFMCGVAEQHQLGNKENFTMLVHTSGKRDEHAEDIRIIQNTINILSEGKHAKFSGLVNKLLDIAKDYGDPKEVVVFVLSNIARHQIIEINSNGSSGSVSDIATPTSLFSFGAGGNIISRGVTFDNLLSMYFTRAVKGSVLSVNRALDLLLSRCRAHADSGYDVGLDWIDCDPETVKFIDFWFAKKQAAQLRLLSYHLMVEPVTRNPATLNLLKVAVSRLIVTKEPKASLARDTAHSRPHRWITENDFDIFDALENSVKHVLRVLDQTAPKVRAKTYLGDARKLSRIGDRSIDCVVTSPPYLNAIDYMRGHKLSLVWWGHTVSELARIRLSAIGTEKAKEIAANKVFSSLSKKYGWDGLPVKSQAVLRQYYFDLSAQLIETARVLKAKGKATYVVGNSNVRGIYVPNHQLLISAAEQSGLELIASSEREIPAHKRYLPTPKSSQNALGGRMRTEHILSFSHRSDHASQ